MFRREADIHGDILQARAYVCGLGYYELFINGQKIGDHVLDPAQTEYDVRALYATYDVTDLLSTGCNVLGLLLGDGWFHQNLVWDAETDYGVPGFILKLVVRFADGSESHWVSDDQWLCTLDGPIRSSNIYAGEIFDARKDIPGWSTPEYDASKWSAVEIADALSPQLCPQLLPPIRRTESLSAIDVWSTRPGVWVFDFGQNIAGRVRMEVTAPAGTEICLRHAETLDPHRDIDPLSTGVLHTLKVQTDRYICHGHGLETWEPTFTYHGFRYVEVTGWPGEPGRSALTAIVLHTDLKQVGEFACSDPLMNSIHATALRTERGNLHGLPTDCPARERCGWLGDANVTAEMTLFNFDALAFWEKYQTDIIDSLGRGEVTYWGAPADPRVPANIAPGRRRCQEARPDWAVTMILLPWYMYLYSGDRSCFVRSYDAMADLMDYFESLLEEHILHRGFGDWCPPGLVEPVDTPVELTSTAYFYYAACCMSRFAQVLHKADKYKALAEQTREAFIHKFFNTQTGSFGSQTANAMALALGLCPDGAQSQVAEALSHDVLVKHGGHFQTGIHGMRHLFWALGDNAQDDACWAALHAEGWPGFSHLFSLGGTTFPETFFDPALHPLCVERSRNHPMQGGFDAWFYNGVAGIAPDPDGPGFARMRFKPQLTSRLQYACATYRSVRGLIKSHWQVKGDDFYWTICTPPNTRATVHIPTSGSSDITESGVPLHEAPGVSHIREVTRFTVCEIVGGNYHFASRDFLHARG